MRRQLHHLIRILILAISVLCAAPVVSPAQTWHNVVDHASTTATAGALNNTTSPITISVASISSFPAVSYWVTIVDPRGAPYNEVAEVTAASTGSMTLTRANPIAHTGSVTIVLAPVAEYFQEIQTEVSSLAASIGGGGSGAMTIGTTTVSSGTAYNALSIGSGGTLTQISPSTSGYVLTSNGTGAAPTFQAATGGSGGGSFSADDMPWIIDIDPFMAAAAQTGFTQLYASSGSTYTIPGAGPSTSTATDQTMPYNVAITSDGVQNDYISFNVALSAGTWTLNLMIYQWMGGGIYSITLDGVALTSLGAATSTVDGYESPGAHGSVASVPNIVVPTTGKHVLTLTLATKNAASTGYGGTLHHITLVRTL